MPPDQSFIVCGQGADIWDRVEFDGVFATPGALNVSDLQAWGSDTGVLLTWRPFRGATSYNIYRAPEGLPIDQVDPFELEQVNEQPVKQSSFADMSPSLDPGFHHLRGPSLPPQQSEASRLSC
jgi:hypothetical protein